MPSHQTDIDTVRPIRTNGNQLRLRLFIGMRSAVLIPPNNDVTTKKQASLLRFHDVAFSFLCVWFYARAFK